MRRSGRCESGPGKEAAGYSTVAGGASPHPPPPPSSSSSSVIYKNTTCRQHRGGVAPASAPADCNGRGHFSSSFVHNLFVLFCFVFPTNNSMQCDFGNCLKDFWNIFTRGDEIVCTQYHSVTRCRVMIIACGRCQAMKSGRTIAPAECFLFVFLLCCLILFLLIAIWTFFTG